MKICSTCEREYKPSSRHKDCPKCRAKKQKTPCTSCGELSNRKHKKCINCHNGAGPESPSWKGGKTRHQKGYIRSWVPGKGYVFEHVTVMEDMIGRPLLEGENVHHKNGIKDDNRPKNLELWTRPQPAGIRVEDAIEHAVEVLQLYAPDLLNGGISDLLESGIRTGLSDAPTSTSLDE